MALRSHERRAGERSKQESPMQALRLRSATLRTGLPPAPQGMKIVQVVILSEAKDLVVGAVGYRGRDSSLRSE